ncbi:GerAB/ArcD/ProY family transporter [Alicyclobacillus macrosporangiidus]|uniref:Spore germination protein n=1 Tax=Alicyclobacillus macrosporangiidus TaxID=392015 RepID=A0A1I7JNH8_9BACL|nr:GerAB/ArcD/ProY family transporter [Alicyclobacillus macrosporangiidus]SFU86742.1 Spore germination protein [Alicyclobacillus macrosporangiidus]
MLKQRNANAVAVLTFELIIGSGMFEWIPAWLGRARTAVWIPLMVYVAVAVALSQIMVYLVCQGRVRRAQAVTVFDALLPQQRVAEALNVLMLLVFLVNAAMVLRMAIHLIKYVALPDTPVLVLVVLGMLIPLQLFFGGFDALLRYELALFWPTVIIGVLMLLLCLEVSDVANLLPLWPISWRAVACTLPEILYLLPGFLLAAVYLPVFHAAGVEAQPMRGMVLGGVLAAVALQLLNVAVVVVDFGPFEGAALNWPIVEAVRMQHGGRWAVLFLLPVLSAVSSAVNLYLYAGYRIAVFHTRARRIWVIGPLMAAVIALSVIPESFEQVSRYYAPVVEGMGGVLLGIVIGLWMWTVWKGGVHAG